MNDAISDFGTSVAETEDLISVLDDDVIELDILVSTLQEENAQLQQTVSLLLQRVSALEATDSITNNTLDGNILISEYSRYCHIHYYICCLIQFS